MPIKEIDAAIAALHTQLLHHENLMDQSIRNDEIFAKTKIIYRDLKEIAEKLKKLKKLKGES